MHPKNFTNVTNGITYRRWLCQSNPLLSNYIEKLIGSGFKQDADKLKDLAKNLGAKKGADSNFFFLPFFPIFLQYSLFDNGFTSYSFGSVCT